ncbi:hypothetical protein F4779DRAFT_622886 [Xylariaceae sp. FL0662B]|nr:hypothetical protein F4779DRAFT_622886 [Xylariaceae sp. FL0662B]
MTADQLYWKETMSYMAIEEFSPFEFLPAPKPSPLDPKHKAVVLSCETIERRLVGGDFRELVVICVLDFFIARPLIHAMVQSDSFGWRLIYDPDNIEEEFTNMDVTPAQAFLSWEEVRTELFNFIDRNTIIIGHDLTDKLSTLRIGHQKVVDVATMTQRAVSRYDPIGTRYHCSLRVLSREFLSQAVYENEGFDGYCLANALIARELVLEYIRDPENLAAWGEGTSTIINREAEVLCNTLASFDPITGAER